MKKLIALFAALIITLGLTVPAFAAHDPILSPIPDIPDIPDEPDEPDEPEEPGEPPEEPSGDSPQTGDTTSGIYFVTVGATAAASACFFVKAKKASELER